MRNKETTKSIPVVYVTPEMAKEWLDTRYKDERTLREGKLKAMVRDMMTGHWLFAGDPIRFNESNGKLMDGQHRLSAIVVSGVGQEFPILNLPEETRATFDTGSARTLGDLLQLGGHVHGRIVAAITRRLVIHFTSDQIGSGGRFVPSRLECVDFIEKNKDELYLAVNVAMKVVRNRLPMAPSAVGAAYFLCGQKDREQAEYFFDHLATGIGLEENSPITALRGRALRAVTSTGRPMAPDDSFRFTLQAWNLYRAGAPAYRIQAPRGGWSRENYPVVK